MRALIPFLAVITAVFGGLRLWLMYTRSREDVSDFARILWRILDVYLIIAAIVIGVFLLILVITLTGEMLNNFS